MISRRRRTAFLAVAAACVLSSLACSQGSARVSHEGEPAPPPVVVPVTLKVISYNVLYGAGHDRRFDENIPPRFRERDRLPDLIAFLQAADADIIAVQEAAGWDEGSPSIAAQMAGGLGMTYVIAPDEWELHVVLLSKYPIVAADYASRFQGFNGVVLRATIAVAPEVEVNVIAVHFNSMSSATRSCQVEAVLNMAASLEGRTLLLGDMNFRPEAAQAETLRGTGWQLVRAQPQWPIDQIWVDSAGSDSTGGWWEGLQPPAGISDHWPIGVDLTLSVPRSAAFQRLPVTEPQALDYACPLPPR